MFKLTSLGLWQLLPWRHFTEAHRSLRWCQRPVWCL